MRPVLGAWLLSLAPVLAVAAPEKGGFIDDSVSVGGQVHPLRVWLPAGPSSGERRPGIVFLHGSGESGSDPGAPTRVGLGPALDREPGAWPFVVAFPQKPTEQEEWVEHEALVLAVRERLVRIHRADPERIALVGMSQGGHGVWFLGARHPHLWSCLVPICGYGRGRTLGTRAAPLPVWAFHGLLDDVVDPRETRELVRWARERRAQLGLDPAGIRMTLYPEVNHGCWDPALAEPGLPAWILAARAETRKSR